MNNIILFGGIHGVGKTYLTTLLAEKYGIERYVASELITEFQKISYINQKRVRDIAENQNILYTALKDFNLFNRIILLEGHFCLLDKHGKIQKIPLKQFQLFNLRAIVLVYEDPKIIYERIKKRNMEHFSISFIKKFQKKEIEYGKEVAEFLDIPITIIKSTDSNMDFIDKFI